MPLVSNVEFEKRDSLLNEGMKSYNEIIGRILSLRVVINYCASENRSERHESAKTYGVASRGAKAPVLDAAATEDSGIDQ